MDIKRRGIGITNDGGFSEVENVEEYEVEGWESGEGEKKARGLEEPPSGTFSKYPDSGRFESVL